MHLVKGTVHMDKSRHQIAYCAQSPWLEHATVRDNIIYGSPQGYDEQRYEAVVEACALVQDLSVLPAGDMTEIGEKGVTLSGGQRARVALARALYSPATTILLDDPLAAVDMHTARHLVEKCLIGELMQGRTVILVTHHVSLCLPVANYLVEISGGKITKQGSVAELMARGSLLEVLKEQDALVHGEEDIKVDDVKGNEADGIADDSERATPSTAEGASNKVIPSWRLSDAQLGKLVEEEARAEGQVSLKTYLTYARAAGYWTWLLTLLLMLSLRLINIASQFYLSKWGEAYDNVSPVPSSTLNQFAMHQIEQDRMSFNVSKVPIVDDFPPPDQNVKPWLLMYLAISVVGATTVLAYISLGYYSSLQASRTLFQRMLRRLSHAPSRFFDITPVGRILNRFVSDIGAVDGAVNNSARGALTGVFSFITSFGVIVWIVPLFTPVAIFIAWLYIRLAPPYVRTSRDLRRLESISLSPAFAGFDELLRGLIHVRAYGVEQRYQNRFYKRVDVFQAFDHSYWWGALIHSSASPPDGTLGWLPFG
jgi:ABC-type multidrug transport system fused ATPase/permease subunit